jgi:hypothetical protein
MAKAKDDALRCAHSHRRRPASVSTHTLQSIKSLWRSQPGRRSGQNDFDALNFFRYQRV